jgi:hypothetical protein
VAKYAAGQAVKLSVPFSTPFGSIPLPAMRGVVQSVDASAGTVTVLFTGFASAWTLPANESRLRPA